MASSLTPSGKPEKIGSGTGVVLSRGAHAAVVEFVLFEQGTSFTVGTLEGPKMGDGRAEYYAAIKGHDKVQALGWESPCLCYDSGGEAPFEMVNGADKLRFLMRVKGFDTIIRFNDRPPWVD